ncbi:hypothetical protein Tco_0763601 [Tanacetum coccineum]
MPSSSSPALKEKHDVIVTSHPSNIIVIFFTCVGSEDLFLDQQDRGHKSTQSYVVVHASVILVYPGLSVHDFKFEDCLKTLVMNTDSIDKNDQKDVQLEDEDIMYDIASSVENWRKRLNDDDVIVVPHEDAQATIGDTNDPFNSISMSTDFADKDIATNDAY